MELMEYNLTQLLDKHQNISMYVKLSILQDVSRGLCYLHTQNPPIVHQALYSDNILLTKGLTAKIADFKTGAETVSEQALLSIRQNKQCNGFLPDLHLLDFDLPLNGCIVCHVITQQCIWVVTYHHDQSIFDMFGLDASVPVEELNCVKKPLVHADYMLTSFTIDDWCVEKHQDYIDLISDSSLKKLVEACLQCKSENRPHMSLVYDRITSVMTGMVELMYIIGERISVRQVIVSPCMYMYLLGRAEPHISESNGCTKFKWMVQSPIHNRVYVLKPGH